MASIINASTSSGVVTTADTSGILQFQTAGTAAVTVDASQNVGIGTASPTSKFCVGTASSGNETNALMQVNMATPTIAGGTGMLALGSTDAAAVDKGGVVSFHANTTTLSGYPLAFIAGKYETAGAGVYSGYLQFATSNSSGTVVERMRIDSAGNITIQAAARAVITTNNTLSFNMNTASNFSCTPTATGALTFTNITSGQSGFILLINTGGYAITAAATTKVSTSMLATISTAGTYLLSYFSNGTNVYVTNSGALS